VSAAAPDAVDGRHVYRQSPAVATRDIAGEVLLVPVRGELAQLQRLFSLNAVGAFIWQQLDGKRDLAAIEHDLVERFEVSEEEARRDLVEYVEGLRQASLIVAGGTAEE
jgi:hypothetical protein